MLGASLKTQSLFTAQRQGTLHDESFFFFSGADFRIIQSVFQVFIKGPNVTNHFKEAGCFHRLFKHLQ